MAKIHIKSEKLTPFGGFFSICKQLFNSYRYHGVEFEYFSDKIDFTKS